MNIFTILVHSLEELHEVLGKVSSAHFQSVDVEQWVPDGNGTYYNHCSKWTREDMMIRDYPVPHPDTAYIRVGNILWQIHG